MVSYSSSKLIKQRTKEMCKEIMEWNINKNPNFFEKILSYLKKEYEAIPEKERIGKGIVYIARNVAKEMFNFLETELTVNKQYLVQIIQEIFNDGERRNSTLMQHLALLLLSEYVLHFPSDIVKLMNLIEKYADHDEWSIRESTLFSLQSGLKTNPEVTLVILSKWVKSKNNKIRRIVAECLRPNRQVPWLRDPGKNDIVLKILTDLRKDPSIYVRKSVGNNIKDLSKYMPEKMLDLMQQWIDFQVKDTSMKIHDGLAMEINLNKEEKHLIWTMKHGMRWIRARNPELHSQLEKILGKYYVLYFDEKRNRLARPLK